MGKRNVCNGKQFGLKDYDLCDGVNGVTSETFDMVWTESQQNIGCCLYCGQFGFRNRATMMEAQTKGSVRNTCDARRRVLCACNLLLFQTKIYASI